MKNFYHIYDLLLKQKLFISKMLKLLTNWTILLLKQVDTRMSLVFLFYRVRIAVGEPIGNATITLYHSCHDGICPGHSILENLTQISTMRRFHIHDQTLPFSEGLNILREMNWIEFSYYTISNNFITHAIQSGLF
jgi:hypothetical protein